MVSELFKYLKDRIMNELAVMDRSGDVKTMWDPRNGDEVEIARKQFDSLRKKGYLIYKVGKDGEKTTAIHEFDPDAGKLIAVPPVVGG
jgi:hypothetical protein